MRLLFVSLLFTVGCSPMMTMTAVTPEALLAGGNCPAPTGAGTVHKDNVTMDETWTAAASPHIVSTLRVEANLTLEPCAVVLFKKGTVVEVGNDGSGKPGKITATGTFDGTTLKPIVFKAETAGERWISLFVKEKGALDFSYVGLTNGGDSSSSTTQGTIEARGSGSKPLQKNLRMKNVVVRDSGTQGIVLSGYAAFTDDSENLTITGSGSQPEADARFFTGFPLDIQPGGVGSIPKGSKLTGNRRDAIYIRSVTRLAVDEAFVNRGVPYIVHGDFLMYDLADKTLLTLRIEAGVTIKFEKSGSGGMRFTLGDRATNAPVKLLAEGTAAAPILLTSAADTPAPGDWGSIYMSLGPATGNRVQYTTFEYAGGFSGTNGFGCGPNVGGLLLIDWRPDDAFVTNSTFRNIIGAGIVSGWTSDAAGPDLSATNSFSNIVDAPMEGHCNVTKWKPMTPGFCAMRPICVN